MNSLWGPFTIDLFADNKNSKCKRFCSRFYCPEAFKINAFCFDWGGEHSLIVPPVYLISRVIKHFLASKKSSGVLILPYWPSAAFWPLLVDGRQRFRKFVKQYRIYEDSKLCLQPGEFRNAILVNKGYTIPILALFISI